ncbi:MAG: DHA2 family efflux MFS transporter permease subunit [Solirubrobacterales bacterium]
MIADEPAIKRRWVALLAMTLANSMILVDQTSVPLATPHLIQGLGASISEGPWILTANILPLAALMVLGGRLGDLLGLRRVFLAGAGLFVVSSTLVGLSQDIVWAIAARALQGTGAALMMPTALAIISSIYPGAERGRALGILAGASAFFAALGPVLGGLLTAIDWRLVFLVNVPLAIATILLTLSSTPDLKPLAGATRKLDYPGTATFGLGVGLIVYALTQGNGGNWGDPDVVGSLIAAAVMLIAFVFIERRAEHPLMEFRLFRHLNFLAANLSQFLAGMVELGMGYLLPFYLLIVIGITPAVAGLALIPATIPIILAGPLAGRAFDRVGGRPPLVVGFLVLAASGVALGLGADAQSYAALVPGLLLQGIGLGIVLTVNDPTGLTSVPDSDRGQGAGMINTTEQLGGALGIAALSAILISDYMHRLTDRIHELGYSITPADIANGKEFILDAEQKGRDHVEATGNIKIVLSDIVNTHAAAYEVTFFVAAGISLVGALTCFLLVRRGDPVKEGPVFSRRSRWIYATAGRSSAVTRRPPPS